MMFRKIIYSRIEPSDKPPKLVELMIEHKIVRNEWQAMATIFAVIIISVSLSVIILNRVWQAQSGYKAGMLIFAGIYNSSAIGLTNNK